MIYQDHHNLVYVKNRIKQWLYFKLNSDKPWMCRSANLFLEEYLNESMSVLEYGCGRSTIFFSRRSKNVYSVETDRTWFGRVKSLTENETNIELKLVPYESSDYVQQFPHESFDVIINDGKYRDLVALDALQTLKKGGCLVIDNAERYLVSGLNLPLNNYIKTNGSQVEIANWDQFESLTMAWRSTWYTDGVSATLIMQKTN